MSTKHFQELIQQHQDAIQQHQEQIDRFHPDNHPETDKNIRQGLKRLADLLQTSNGRGYSISSLIEQIGTVAAQPESGRAIAEALAPFFGITVL